MKFIIKLLITLAIFYLLSTFVDIKEVSSHILQAELPYVLLAILSQFLSTALASYRWFFIMQILKFKETFLFYFESYFKGSFFNQLLPSNIGGDAVRILDLRAKGYATREAFYGVLIDRVLGIVALLILNIIANLSAPDMLPQSLYETINTIAAVGVTGVLVLILFHRNDTLANLPLISHFSEMSLRFYTVFRETANFLKQLGMSITIHLFSIFSVYMLMLAVGVDLSFNVFLIIMPIVILFMAVPISLAGWGIREGAMVGLFMLVGAPKEEVLSVSLLYGIVVIITILPGFYYWAINKNRLL